MRRLAVISAPGAFHAFGAAALVGEALELKVFSVGDHLREHVRQRTAWGRRVSDYLEAGHLVPEDVVTELVVDMLTGVMDGWLLFGHPRSVRQATLLAETDFEPELVVEVTVRPEEFERDWPRSEQLQQLPDRLARHRSQVAALQAFYRQRSRFHVVSGAGGLDAVAGR